MKPLPVGSLATDFTLTDHAGNPYNLSNVVRNKIVLLIFYPTDWGQICFHELTTFRDMQARFEEANCQLVAISYNDVVSHGLWREELRLNYPILSDRTGEVAASFGVLDGDDESFNQGRSDRALFLIDKNMIIKWSWVAPQIWFEPDYEEVLRAVSGKELH